MIDNALVKQIEAEYAAAEMAESNDNYTAANGHQSNVDALLLLLVKRYYGAMPKTDSWGRLIIPAAIKTEVVDSIMPGSVFPGLV